MTDLADFLRARYAEDAQAVRANWHRDSITSEQYHGTPIDPTRLLADLDAKLAIVNRHAACGTGNGYCDDGGHGDLEGGGCADLADLARPFAGHPDYQEDWAA
ncbi:DUF6221 family protein [Streptomyces anulatus]|uniref:DUF6221 family protein n=1 Tax=Streptomyces anulatus TaxID=1892 RepID=UPI0034277B11